MPLKKGQGSKIRSENIGELRRSGYPEDQAVAIAYSEQRQEKKKARRHTDKRSHEVQKSLNGLRKSGRV